MSELPPAMAAALAQSRVVMFGAVRIALPTHTIRLLDGSGALMIGGEIYQGRDPVYGVLDTIEGIEEGIGSDAPTITLGLIPASDTALNSLIDPAIQGGEVIVMIGVVDMSTGQPVATPYDLFIGELDVPTIDWEDSSRRLKYHVVSVAERLFQVEEGRRLVSAFHTRVWPGEKGLDFCTAVERVVPWGEAVDPSAVYTRSNLPGYAETYNRT